MVVKEIHLKDYIHKLVYLKLLLVEDIYLKNNAYKEYLSKM